LTTRTESQTNRQTFQTPFPSQGSFNIIEIEKLTFNSIVVVNDYFIRRRSNFINLLPFFSRSSWIHECHDSLREEI